MSFVTVNRWEKGKSKPSDRLWSEVLKLEPRSVSEKPPSDVAFARIQRGGDTESMVKAPDFTGDPNITRMVIEGDRLSHGHLFNPTFATEAALIDPLPHQRIAVYEHMLTQPRLRFLLADDAGAGKTIMAGLYIREMLARRLIRRVLIVPPAGLASNWRRELSKLLGLHFNVIAGSDARLGNPFSGPNGDLVIAKLDTLAGENMFKRLQEDATEPYDLVVFDEAHKLSADRDPDYRMRRTDRYRLAEALCGASHDIARWRLGWQARHILLLTATPHMGKDFPYYCLWRLLEPEVLATSDAFGEYPQSERSNHFIRRTKEEMVYYDGTPIYKQRQCDTLPFDLTQGSGSEQELYDATTEYIRYYYNKSRILNRSAARLAMSVFQRRMASSTYALKCSLQRRLERLDKYIADMKAGAINEAIWTRFQEELNRKLTDAFEARTPDEESPIGGREESETEEDRALEAFAVPLSQLEDERVRVEKLLALASRVYDKGEESKFNRLHELLRESQFKNEKLIVFTEYRDTMEFLARRFEGLGFAGRIARIHGGMSTEERDDQVEFFRRGQSDTGAQILVATDAAGEGINLQFCWAMVNYDIPWNPARLEQRMGRIHRYGQQHDPVVIANLLSPKTREGRVLKVLLEKLERIRKEMHRDKVFDVIGRLLEGMSLREYMAQVAVSDETADVESDIDARLSSARVNQEEEAERSLYGSGDVKPHLKRLRQDMEHETYLRLLPGFVRNFVDKAAPALGLDIQGDLDGCFSFVSQQPDALDPFLAVMEQYSSAQRNCLTVRRPDRDAEAIFLRPGDALFDRMCGYVGERFRPEALRGAVFVDPNADSPYFLHLLLIGVERGADPELASLSRPETLGRRLVALRQELGGAITECPIERLLLLRGHDGVPIIARRLALQAGDQIAAAREFAVEHVAMPLAEQYRLQMQRSLPERLGFLDSGYRHQEIELALARSRLRGKAESGEASAKQELERVKERQRRLFDMQEGSVARLKREPELIAPVDVQFLAHALVVPSADPEEKMRHDAEVEAIAVSIAKAHEEEFKAKVRDVSTSAKARAHGLGDWPGFDLLSLRPGAEERAIEVKGRAESGTVELSENEWAKSCNLGNRYWLYVVFDCASPRPRLYRVQDPFKRLLARAKGGVILDGDDVIRSAEADFRSGWSSKED